MQAQRFMVSTRAGASLLALGLTLLGCGEGAAEPRSQAAAIDATSEAEDIGVAPVGSSATDIEREASDMLPNRAYVVSLDSDDLAVIDLDAMDLIAKVPTGGVENHMLAANADLTKLYVASTHTDEVIVLDAEKLNVLERVQVGFHPTHLNLSPALPDWHDGLLAIIEEGGGSDGRGAVALLDTRNDRVVGRVQGLLTPHFIRFAADGAGRVAGYVANFAGNHISRVDLTSMEVVEQIGLDGLGVSDEPLDWEGGFADVQVASDGMLYAAHAATGRILSYDTLRHVKMSEELTLGDKAVPWVVFAEHPFENVEPVHVVNSMGTRRLRLIDGRDRTLLRERLSGDEESYGVNFSSVTPGLAFVMKRAGESVDVVDLSERRTVDRIDVGGNTETASTSADGRYIVAAVSGADKVVVIEAATRRIVKTFEGVGRYPWSVFIPGGQNYCH